MVPAWRGDHTNVWRTSMHTHINTHLQDVKLMKEMMKTCTVLHVEVNTRTSQPLQQNEMKTEKVKSICSSM